MLQTRIRLNPCLRLSLAPRPSAKERPRLGEHHGDKLPNCYIVRANKQAMSTLYAEATSMWRWLCKLYSHLVGAGSSSNRTRVRSLGDPDMRLWDPPRELVRLRQNLRVAEALPWSNSASGLPKCRLLAEFRKAEPIIIPNIIDLLKCPVDKHSRMSCRAPSRAVCAECAR